MQKVKENENLKNKTKLHPDYRHCEICGELIHIVNGKERGHEPDNCEGKKNQP